MNRYHAHRRYLPPAEPPRESLASALFGGACLVFFIVTFCTLLWLAQ